MLPELLSTACAYRLQMSDEFLFPVILVVAGFGFAILIGISVIMLFRRQSLPYFLVTLAIGTFLPGSFLGAVVLGGVLYPRAPPHRARLRRRGDGTPFHGGVRRPTDQVRAEKLCSIP